MTAPIDMADFAARVSRPPFWPAVEQPKPTADNPIPSRPGPRSNEQMSADARAITDELWAAIGRSRRARGADEQPQGRAA